MPTQERQVRKFACVVECEPHDEKGGITIKEDSLEEHLKDLAVLLNTTYWAIIHDMDTDENGVIKRPHIHLVLETRSRHTCLGIVRAIADNFAICNERISVRETKNQNGAIRYLMHLDDFEKTPYPPFDVYTNNQEALNYAICSTEQELTWETLKKAIKGSKTKVQLIEKIGLKNYTRYSRVIDEFWNTDLD